MLGGECQGQPLEATSVAGQQTGRLLYVTVCESRLCFLVHTGSAVGIIPISKAERKNRQDAFGLLTANNSPIMTYRTRSLTLNLGLCHIFRWVFVVANARNPIPGADFLKYYGLVVDMCSRRLLDIRTQLSLQGIISLSPSHSPTLLPKKSPNNFMAFMANFRTITQPCSKDRPIKHDITHHINTTGPPVSANPRRLAHEHLKTARQESEHMLELSIIRPSSSSWSTPLHMVVKRYGRLASVQ